MHNTTNNQKNVCLRMVTLTPENILMMEYADRSALK